MKIFNNPTASLLKKSLDILTGHNRNISENVANMHVEGYKRKPTRFLDEMMAAQRQTAMKTSNPRHMRIDPEDRPVPQWEKGSVMITREMADLAQNQIRYDFSARVLRRKFDGLTASITGRIR
ncbi:MAG: hypothetical protein KAU50_12040 [Candidatus Marinimicrobia bacterium]|nr:hypothetical protein [Candidatus Neomarinimicrobiota bacterium]